MIYEGNYIAHLSMGIKYFHLVTEQIKKKRFLEFDTTGAVPQDSPEIPGCSILLKYQTRFGY